MISAIEAAKILEVTVPTARNALQNLQKLGIVKDISGRGKERIYVYTELVTLLEQGAG
jgi:ribosomal protein S25